MTVQHPTPPVTTTIGAALRALPAPKTGRQWMSWDEAMRLSGQTAEFQDEDTTTDTLTANPGRPGMVGRRPGH